MSKAIAVRLGGFEVYFLHPNQPDRQRDLGISRGTAARGGEFAVQGVDLPSEVTRQAKRDGNQPNKCGLTGWIFAVRGSGFAVQTDQTSKESWESAKESRSEGMDLRSVGVKCGPRGWICGPRGWVCGPRG
jgi:hypothetical protein